MAAGQEVLVSSINEGLVVDQDGVTRGGSRSESQGSRGSAGRKRSSDRAEELASPETPDERRKELYERLVTYCEMDTLALVKLAGFFQTGR